MPSDNTMKKIAEWEGRYVARWLWVTRQNVVYDTHTDSVIDEYFKWFSDAQKRADELNKKHNGY